MPSQTKVDTLFLIAAIHICVVTNPQNMFLFIHLIVSEFATVLMEESVLTKKKQRRITKSVPHFNGKNVRRENDALCPKFSSLVYLGCELLLLFHTAKPKDK